MNTISYASVAVLLGALGCSSSQQPAPRHATSQSSTVVASERHDHRHGEEAKKAKKPKYAPGTPMHRGQTLLDEKSWSEAAAVYADVTAAEPDNAHAWLLYGYALHADGRLDEALAIHERAATFDAVAPIALYNKACVHALRGEPDAAFEALDRAIDKGFAGVDYLESDSDLASLRGDARFPAVVEKAKARSAEQPCDCPDSDAI